MVAAGVICAGLSWGAGAAAAQGAFTQVVGSPFQAESGPLSVAFSPGGALLATAETGPPHVAVYSVAADGALVEPPDDTATIGSGMVTAAFSPSGKLLAAFCAAVPGLGLGSGVSVFSVHSGGVLDKVGDFPTGTPASGSSSSPQAMAFSPDGRLLATADWASDTVTLYSVGSGGVLTDRRDLPFTNPWSVAFSPGGQLLAIASRDDSTVSMYEVDRVTGGPVFRDKAATGHSPNSVAFSPNGGLLATANGDGTVSLFSVDRSTGGLTHVNDFPTGSGSSNRGVAFSPGGGLLAAANSGFPGSVAVFSVVPDVTLEEVSASPFPTTGGNSAYAVAFSPRGLFAATQFSNDTLGVWRATGSFEISKSADRADVAPGETVTYVLTVHNPSPDPMTGVVNDDLRGVLDKATYLHDAHATFGGVVVRTGPKRLIWDGTVPAGGTAKITYSVKVHGAVGGFLSNSVTGSPGSKCVAAPGFDLPCVTEIPIVERPAPGAQLQLTKTASSATVHPGGQVLYTLVVQNHGPLDATGVTVEDPNPAGLLLQTVHTDAGSCTITFELVCHLGSIPSGGGALIQVTATVPTSATGTIDNKAIVFDDQGASSTASSTVHVTPLPSPAPDPGPQPVSSLVVTKHVNHRTAVRGQTLRYTITVTNHGPDQAGDVKLTDTSRLPLSVLSIHPGQGRCQTGAPFTCALGTIRNGQHITITITATATTTGSQINAVAATSTSWQPDPAASIAAAHTTILAPPTPPSFTG